MITTTTMVIKMVTLRGRPISKRMVTTLAWGGDPDAWERMRGGIPEANKKEKRMVGGMARRGIGMAVIGRVRRGWRWEGGVDMVDGYRDENSDKYDARAEKYNNG